MASVRQFDDRDVGILADSLPDALPVTKETQIGTLRVVFGLTVDQGGACPTRAIPVPNGVNKGSTAVGKSDSDVKANWGVLTVKAPSGVIPRKSE